MVSIFRAGGLASGLDTNTIIDSLVQIESQPLAVLQKRQSALQTQISALGDLASRLSNLQSAAVALGTTGALGVKVSSTHTDFTAAASSTASPGRYQVQVTSLAAAAKQRSAVFAAGTSPVTGGNLHIKAMGAEFDVAIADGAKLSDVASAINQSGAAVNAAVLTNASGSYLSVTNRDTGHPIGSAAADALVLTHTTTGSQGIALGFASVATASNTKFNVDGLDFESTTSSTTTAIPGTTLTAKATGAVQELVLGTDADATAANIQRFVDGYNDTYRMVQRQLSVVETTNRSSTLAGDGALRSLQQQLQRLVSTPVTADTGVRSLADLGVKSARDGSLSIDRTALDKAIAKNPGAVNDLFSRATTGLTDATKKMVDTFTDPVDGVLVTRKAGLSKSVTKLTDEADRLQTRLDAFRENLVKQYTAMEKVVSNLKNIGTYLTQQDAQRNKGG